MTEAQKLYIIDMLKGFGVVILGILAKMGKDSIKKQS